MRMHIIQHIHGYFGGIEKGINPLSKIMRALNKKRLLVMRRRL
jgi:hypothetical protein